MADIIITNDGTLEQYDAQVEAVLSGGEPRVPGIVHKKSVPEIQASELYRCLTALAEANRPLDSGEISVLASIRPNNANKALKVVPELARRLERGRRIRYAITDAGRTYIRLLAARAAAASLSSG